MYIIFFLFFSQKDLKEMHFVIILERIRYIRRFIIHPCHLAECYKELSYHVGDIPYAEQCAASEISLPIYAGMPMEEVEYVIQIVNEFS